MSTFSDFVLVDFEDYCKVNFDVSRLRLADLECKHFLFTNEKTRVFAELAEKVNYKWALFGSHRGTAEKDRVDFEIQRIREMALSSVDRPVRIVKTSDGKIFVDNTHWALAYIERLGLGVRLCDIPFYVVDFSHSAPIVVDVKDSVFKDRSHIKGAVEAASEIEKRLRKGWRPQSVTYKLKDMIKEIESAGNC